MTDHESNILYMFYSNAINVLSSKDEIVILFGQTPTTSDNKIPAVRITIRKDFAPHLISMIKSAMENYEKGVTDPSSIDKKEHKDFSYG